MRTIAELELYRNGAQNADFLASIFGLLYVGLFFYLKRNLSRVKYDCRSATITVADLVSVPPTVYIFISSFFSTAVRAARTAQSFLLKSFVLSSSYRSLTGGTSKATTFNSDKRLHDGLKKLIEDLKENLAI
jgi:hypothetical protein